VLDLCAQITIRVPVFTMSPTTTAPDPTATASVVYAPDALLRVDVVQDQPADVASDGVAERELRLEFEAIIAAGYGGGADEPRPVPPSRRVAVIVGGARPVARSAVPTGSARPVLLRPAPTAGPAPRERGPPAFRPARLLCAAVQLPVQQHRPHLSPRDHGWPLASTVDRVGPGVRRHRTSTSGGCTSPTPATAPARRT
jgi:hypothetical protein